MLRTICRIRNWISAITLALVGFDSTALVAQNKQTPKPEASRKFNVTVKELRDAGIAFDTLTPKNRKGNAADSAAGFPNKCYQESESTVGLTVSDKLLAEFRAKGFSLATLCLGLSSPHILTHPETGRPLMVVKVRKPGPEFELLLDIPNCLKNGTPYLDCTFNYEWGGDAFTNMEDETRERWADTGRAYDEMIRLLQASGKYTRSCECSDMEMHTERDDEGKKQSGVKPKFRIKPAAYCYVDTLPSCAQTLSRGTVLAGRLYVDFDQFSFDQPAVEKVLGLNPDGSSAQGAKFSNPRVQKYLQADGDRSLWSLRSRWGIVNESFDISPKLPRGYAYRIVLPEGDDDTPYRSLPPGRRIGVGAQ